MAKDRKAIEEQIAALQAELEDDDDTELLVEHPKTKAVGRLRGSHARSFLAGVLGTDEDDDQDDDEDDEDDEEPPARKAKKRTPADKDKADQPPARQSVWGRR